MLNYLIRRLLISAVTLVVISMVIFGILKVAPGDPLPASPTIPTCRPNAGALRKQMGWTTRFRSSTRNGRGLCARRLGAVVPSKQPARDIIFGRLPVTLEFLGSAFCSAS